MASHSMAGLDLIFFQEGDQAGGQFSWFELNHLSADRS